MLTMFKLVIGTHSFTPWVASRDVGANLLTRTHIKSQTLMMRRMLVRTTKRRMIIMVKKIRRRRISKVRTTVRCLTHLSPIVASQGCFLENCNRSQIHDSY